MEVKKERLTFIDDLRGISILVMIMIHTNAYFLTNKIAYTLLEISQFAVVAFIFCSAYLFYTKKQEISFSFIGNYFKKRAARLLPPYYLYLLVFYLFLFFKEPKKLTPLYFFRTITMTGGIDFNWLVFLFLELSILIPLLKLLKDKYRIIFYIFSVLAFLSSLLFLKYTPLPDYRYFMWLPWSLVLVFTLYTAKHEENRRFRILSFVVPLILYLGSREFQIATHHTLYMYNNKYPPNIYHLSYGLFFIPFFIFLSRRGFFSFSPLRKCIHYLSVNSYSIFFIHVLVIYFLTVFMKIRFTWVSFFLVTLAVTVFVQEILNRLSRIFSPPSVE